MTEPTEGPRGPGEAKAMWNRLDAHSEQIVTLRERMSAQETRHHDHERRIEALHTAVIEGQQRINDRIDSFGTSLDAIRDSTSRTRGWREAAAWGIGIVLTMALALGTLGIITGPQNSDEHVNYFDIPEPPYREGDQ